MVDSKSNSNLLYLPLDRLLQQSGNTAPGSNPAGGMQPQSGAAQPATGTEAPAPSGSASVPSLRDRLRESR
jgi:modulator of FtsH protease HflK